MPNIHSQPSEIASGYDDPPPPYSLNPPKPPKQINFDQILVEVYKMNKWLERIAELEADLETLKSNAPGTLNLSWSDHLAHQDQILRDLSSAAAQKRRLLHRYDSEWSSTYERMSAYPPDEIERRISNLIGCSDVPQQGQAVHGPGPITWLESYGAPQRCRKVPIPQPDLFGTLGQELPPARVSPLDVGKNKATNNGRNGVRGSVWGRYAGF